MNKAVAAFVVFLLVGSCLHLAFGLGNIVDALKHEHASGWAQAIGTVLAVLATGAVAWWEAHQRRLEAALRFKEQTLARLALVDRLSSYMAAYARSFQHEEPALSSSLERHYAPLRMLMDEVSAIGVREMPTSRSANYFLRVRAEIETVRAILDKTGPNAPAEEDRERIKKSSESVAVQARLLPHAVKRWGKGDGPGI